MAFKMKGSPMLRNFGIGAPTKKAFKLTGETDPPKGDDSGSADDALTRAVLRAQSVQFPKGIVSDEAKEAYMNSPEGRAAVKAANIKAEEVRSKGGEYWQQIEQNIEESKKKSEEKRAAKDAEAAARLEAKNALNEAGYHRMNKRQQKRFREENPQYFL